MYLPYITLIQLILDTSRTYRRLLGQTCGDPKHVSRGTGRDLLQRPLGDSVPRRVQHERGERCLQTAGVPWSPELPAQRLLWRRLRDDMARWRQLLWKWIYPDRLHARTNRKQRLQPWWWRGSRLWRHVIISKWVPPKLSQVKKKTRM